MWRPPDKKKWIQIKRKHCKVIAGKADCEHCPTEPMECNRSFEAGADAMLAALRARGIGDLRQLTCSKLVLIPDETNE